MKEGWNALAAGATFRYQDNERIGEFPLARRQEEAQRVEI